jgi:ketopantoate hydroxymethyltransferase
MRKPEFTRATVNVRVQVDIRLTPMDQTVEQILNRAGRLVREALATDNRLTVNGHSTSLVTRA